MKKTLIFTAISMTVLTTGLTLSYWRSLGSKESAASIEKVMTVEEYWQTTGLKSQAALNIINSKSCYSSERYFLGCINGVLSAAEKFGLTLDYQGQLVPASGSKILSEKEVLLGWQAHFRRELVSSDEIQFEDLISALVKKDKQISSAITALAINGFVSVFRDPHTYIMSMRYFDEVVSKADTKSTAFGIVLAKDQKQYFIKKVLELSPAEEVGLKKGDVLVSIQGQVIGSLPFGKVTELLKGKIGDKISLLVERNNKRIQFEYLRKPSQIPAVHGKLISGLRRVGLISLNKFAPGVCQQVKNQLERFKHEDIRGLLLDLRDNPGGQMDEAACVAGLFLGSDKKVFELRYLDPGREIESYSSSSEKIYDGPVAVLINAGSASAAEIVAGSLRDWGRAVLVGERTFGKGSFQEGEIWSENDKVALFQTKGFYYLPSGESPQGTGIAPDVTVNFKPSIVMRESDQYWSSLKAPARKGWVASKKTFNSENCFGFEDTASDDVELSKAKESLFCSAASMTEGGL